jgi:hypothetical protein
MKGGVVVVNQIRRRLAGLLVAILSAGIAASLVAAPAHAAYSAPQNVDIQLRSYNAYYQEYLVGRVVGTVQFDDSNSLYRVSLVVCRQSSYTAPNLTLLVNGSHHKMFTPYDGVRRPEICGNNYPTSGAVDLEIPYAGTIYNLTVRLQGVHFDFNTAHYIVRERTYDNPFN